MCYADSKLDCIHLGTLRRIATRLFGLEGQNAKAVILHHWCITTLADDYLGSISSIGTNRDYHTTIDSKNYHVTLTGVGMGRL